MGNSADEKYLVATSNLPSRHWKIRRIRTAYDKKLRYLDKEYSRVCYQIRNLGYEELIPPIQRGYKRLFVLTEETKHNKHQELYQRILDKINTIWYSSDKSFKQKKRKIKRWKYKYKKEQTLQSPEAYLFHYEGKFTEEEKLYFYPVEYYNIPGKKHCIQYVFAEPWRYRLQVKPNMITQIQIKDSQLEQYRDELNDYLDKDKNRRRLTKMRGGNTYSWKKILNKRSDRNKYRYNSFTNKPLHEITEHYKEEKQW